MLSYRVLDCVVDTIEFSEDASAHDARVGGGHLSICVNFGAMPSGDSKGSLVSLDLPPLSTSERVALRLRKTRVALRSRCGKTALQRSFDDEATNSSCSLSVTLCCRADSCGNAASSLEHIAVGSLDMSYAPIDDGRLQAHTVTLRSLGGSIMAFGTIFLRSRLLPREYHGLAETQLLRLEESEEGTAGESAMVRGAKPPSGVTSSSSSSASSSTAAKFSPTWLPETTATVFLARQGGPRKQQMQPGGGDGESAFTPPPLHFANVARGDLSITSSSETASSVHQVSSQSKAVAGRVAPAIISDDVILAALMANHGALAPVSTPPHTLHESPFQADRVSSLKRMLPAVYDWLVGKTADLPPPPFNSAALSSSATQTGAVAAQNEGNDFNDNEKGSTTLASFVSSISPNKSAMSMNSSTLQISPTKFERKAAATASSPSTREISFDIPSTAATFSSNTPLPNDHANAAAPVEGIPPPSSSSTGASSISRPTSSFPLSRSLRARLASLEQEKRLRPPLSSLALQSTIRKPATSLSCTAKSPTDKSVSLDDSTPNAALTASRTMAPSTALTSAENDQGVSTSSIVRKTALPHAGGLKHTAPEVAEEREGGLLSSAPSTARVSAPSESHASLDETPTQASNQSLSDQSGNTSAPFQDVSGISSASGRSSGGAFQSPTADEEGFHMLISEGGAPPFSLHEANRREKDMVNTMMSKSVVLIGEVQSNLQKGPLGTLSENEHSGELEEEEGENE